MHQSKDIKGFIFDLDGTLMHSELDFDYLRRTTGCPPGQDILEFADSLDEVSRIKVHETIFEHEIEDARAAVWIEGALDCLQNLIPRPIAIVTRNCKQAASLKLGQNHQLFDYVITREDAPPKPDPSALLFIANQWQIAPRELAYVGDYLYDIEAANRAGMLSCLYSPRSLPDYANQADVVFTHFSEITPNQVAMTQDD